VPWYGRSITFRRGTLACCGRFRRFGRFGLEEAEPITVSLRINLDLWKMDEADLEETVAWYKVHNFANPRATCEQTAQCAICFDVPAPPDSNYVAKYSYLIMIQLSHF
jgi:hypothetical protein